MWWKGPNFLRKPKTDWPPPFQPTNVDESIIELRQSTFVANVDIKMLPQDFQLHPSKFSVGKIWDGFVKCLRITALVLRAVSHFKAKRHLTSLAPKPITIIPLTKDEILGAENFQIKLSQAEHYQDEIRVLKNKQELTRDTLGHSSDLIQYSPFLDTQNMLRSNSRLTLSNLPINVTCPFILHRKSSFAKLLLFSLHFRIAHPLGLNALKAKIRENYLIHGLGTLILHIKSACLKCHKDKNIGGQQKMAALPDFRVDIPLKAFANTGLDFAGPFSIKVGRGKVRKKASVLVLTCLSVRAVHLEVCPSQDTGAVFNALSRFCDIRGVPELILSDNQTSFRSTSSELEAYVKQIDFDNLVARTAYGYKDSKGIRWEFNPPLSPHFGGVFEIMVKATKRALKATVGEADLNEDEFRTAISGCMNLLNSRPIAQLGTVFDEPPLTPNHFLYGMCGGSLAPPAKHEDEQPVKRWRRVQIVIKHFWSRFLKEIIPLLQPRRKWRTETENFKVDDIVLEIDPNIPRGQWRLAKVIEVYPSPDGLVRKVKIMTSNRHEYERSIARLVHLA